MWQAEADNVSSLSASPATALGQILFEYGTLRSWMTKKFDSPLCTFLCNISKLEKQHLYAADKNLPVCGGS